LMEAAFEESKEDVESDVIFGGHEEILTNLNLLQFDSRHKRLKAEESDKKHILHLDFKEIRRLNLVMKRKLDHINRLIMEYNRNNTQETGERLTQDLCNFFWAECDLHGARIIYKESHSAPYPCDLNPVTVKWILDRSAPLAAREIWVDGLITSGIIDLLQESMQKNYKRLLTLKWYDLEVLSRIRDFRTLVNLSYVVHLSKAMGISTKLDPVLSFPLGPNAISISEAALAYQTIMTGRTYALASQKGPADIPAIAKIVDREGEVLWKNKQKPEKILSDRLSQVVTEILREVVETGTGRAARDAVQVCFGEKDEKTCVAIPCFGKTGTANRFTNSSFVGFIPAPRGDTGQLDIREGYVIASYVGYDDNRPMKGRHSAIYGASGALPLWVDTANAIVNARDYKKNLQPADLAFEPATGVLTPGLNGMQAVPVSPVTGLPVGPSEKSLFPFLPEVLGEADKIGDKWELKRYFEPLKGKTE